MTKKIGDTVERGARNIRYAPNRGQTPIKFWKS